MSSHPLPENDLRSVAQRVRWDELRGARVLVAGGTGFFGHWLVESLLHAVDLYNLDTQILVLARSPGRLARHPNLFFLQGDVRDFCFPRGEISHVVHLATDATLEPTPENADRTVDTIVNGTRRLLQLARERGAKRFLLASSGAVYGSQPEGVERLDEGFLGEIDLDHAIAPYAEAKKVAEILVGRAGGIDATIARCFAFVGPGLPLDSHFAIGNFLRDGLAGRPVEIRGDATAVRSYLYAADLAVWLWTILLRGNGVYNVGSEKDVAIHDLAALVAQETDTRVSVAPTVTARPTSHRYIPDTHRARLDLGLEETISLRDAIRRTLQYHKAQETINA